MAGKFVPIRRRVNNFGDLLGPVVVQKLLQTHHIDHNDAIARSRLLSIGSVLHFARKGDVIWGSGINGKMLHVRYRLQKADIRAVRGPRTQAFLREIGVDAPSVFGDPGLLVGTLWTREELRGNAVARAVSVVPNIHDWPAMRDDPRVIDPRSPLDTVVARIAASDFVVGSSLHGIIVAEALGIPARTIQGVSETEFKYADYFEGTGREVEFARDVNQAIAWGGQSPPLWDPDQLVRAFPFELWKRPTHTTVL